MEKFEMPNIKVETLCVEDIVTASNWQEGGAGEDD